jgi:hypothetical protein
VRAYGEMVDILWQAGNRDAAIRLEEYWNELAKLQTFSLFCAYRLDPLDSELCKVHTHLVPSREWRGLEKAVQRASQKVLEQATLFWLKQNMPRTAEKVLSELRERDAPAE